jgi:thiamine kinase-like enzyme
MAQLHAKTWLHPARKTFRDGFVDSGHLDMYLTEGNWAVQRARPRWAAVPAELDDWDRVTRGIRAAWDLKRSGDTCILHGDPHIENWYMDAQGRPGLLDWQLVSEGRWAWDLIYFLSGAMDPTERQATERDLLKHYLAELAGHGGPAPSLDEALTECARLAIWSLVVLLSPGGIQREDFTIVRVERAAQATLDWDSLGALGVR